MLFDIKQGDESLTSHSGLALIGLLLQKTKIQERINAVSLPDHPYPAIRHGDIAQAMIGLLCLGQPDFAAIEAFRDDPFFRAALQLEQIPSEATLRQRLDSARELWTASTPRPGKTVYRGAFAVVQEGSDRPARRVFEVTERTCDRNGQIFLEPEIEVDTYDTSRPEAPETIIAWYHAHGASEQFHSEIKSDLDLERLPSGKFATNALVLLLGLVAYNCLRLCGQEALRDEGLPPVDRVPVRKPVARRRLRSVMQDLMYMACRVITHARRRGLAFGKGNPWYRVWRRVYLRFAAASS